MLDYASHFNGEGEPTDRQYPCLDCDYNTLPDEYYSVDDRVWEQTGLGSHDGFLCIGCIEARIGRRLKPYDFPDFPINTHERYTQLSSQRLNDRRGS